MIDRCAPALYLALIALMAFGGVLGIVLGCLWMAGGAYFVAKSQSRGFLADAAFFLTWPIWLIVEA